MIVRGRERKRIFGIHKTNKMMKTMVIMMGRTRRKTTTTTKEETKSRNKLTELMGRVMLMTACELSVCLCVWSIFMSTNSLISNKQQH